jgi:hypothetical protein
MHKYLDVFQVISCGPIPEDVMRKFKTGTPEWRKHMADTMKEEMSQPEVYWWLSFCDPDLPKGNQFKGVIVVKAHGLTDALTKCNAMMINPGGEVSGFEIPDSEEARTRLVPEVLNRLISLEEMIKLGWEPYSTRE